MEPKLNEQSEIIPAEQPETLPTGQSEIPPAEQPETPPAEQPEVLSAEQPETLSAASGNISPKTKTQDIISLGQEVLSVVGDYLTDGMQETVVKDIQRLIEQQGSSVSELRKNGNLPAEVAKKSEALLRGRQVDVGGLTIKQTGQLYDFVMETTEEARYGKGVRLYGLLSKAVSYDETRARDSYAKIGRRRFGETPEYGAYDNADEFDRRGYRRDKVRMTGIRERYSELRYRFEGKGSSAGWSDKYRDLDEFSRRIGEVTARHKSNMEMDDTLTDDNTDMMHDRDLEWAVDKYDEEEDYSAEYDENEDLVYGIFTENDLAFAEEEIELRSDIGSSATNDLHTERLREVYTSGGVSDLVDQLDVDYIEEVIGENRLTAKSAVALGYGALTRAVKTHSMNSVKINELARKVHALTRQLLNISGDRSQKIEEKYESRGEATWVRVNRGVNNSKKIDDLLQYTQELTVLLSLQTDEHSVLLTGGDNGETDS
ncbi:MAG: hypothetical protein LBQ02_01790 [Candidatus Nomurabacteria bacterium]|nr:hypothetical protein [Candidatus Nomurabacteria bacterium]